MSPLITIQLLIQAFLETKLKSWLWGFTVAIMSSLPVKEYLCHRWPWKRSVYSSHIPFPLNGLFLNKTNTTGATSRAGTGYSSGALEFIAVFSEPFFEMYFESLLVFFVLFPSVVVLHILRFIAYGYPFILLFPMP